MCDVVILIDIGSTFTKVTAVDIKNECIVGNARAFTTVDTDINEGLNKALNSLKESIGEFNIVKRLAASSAAGGLKMISIGLVPELTVKAAKMAALSAGAKLMQTYSFELCEDEVDE
ncbi:MAG: glutamate mutase L, partial [Clostridia bacterium]